MLYSTAPGDVAQLEERDVRNVEARGSSPLISTTISKIYERRCECDSPATCGGSRFFVVDPPHQISERVNDVAGV